MTLEAVPAPAPEAKAIVRNRSAARIRHVVSLDGLRGLAALMVFVNHVQLPGLHPALIGMDAGVLVFFSLSGYLLYAPFAQTRNGGARVRLGSYAVRRLLRIMPAYLLASVVIAAVWFPWFLSDPIALVTMQRTPILLVWTLQIEVVFYAALPLLAALIGRLPERRRIIGLIALAGGSIFVTVGIIVAANRTGRIATTTDLSTIASYLWAFVPGMIVAEIEAGGALPRVRPIVALGGVGLIALSVALDAPSYLDLAAGAGSGLLIAFLVARRELFATGPLARLVTAAGAVSYSLYLWHESIIDAVDRPPSWTGAAVALTISLVIAGLVYVVVERPAIRFGQAFGRWRVPPARVPGDDLSGTGPR